MALKKALLFLILVALTGVPVHAEEITVAAAADLNYAMKDLAAQFQQKTGNKSRSPLGRREISIRRFRAALPTTCSSPPTPSIRRSWPMPGKSTRHRCGTYALGHLVLWIPNSSKLDLQKLKMDVLLQPSVQKIAIANPEHAPYGRAAWLRCSTSS